MTVNALGPPNDTYYESYNAWRAGNTKLNWYGWQWPDQGLYGGQYPKGTPTAWTSNSSVSPGYQPDNMYVAAMLQT